MDGRQKFSHQLLSKVVGDVVVVPIVFPPLGVREALLFFVPLCQIETYKVVHCELRVDGRQEEKEFVLR